MPYLPSHLARKPVMARAMPCSGAALILILLFAAAFLVPFGLSRSAAQAADSASGEIIFASDQDGDYDIYRLNIATSELTNLTVASPLNESVPTWSPDGSQIAFIRANTPFDRELWVMNADGSGQRAVVWDDNPSGPATWSPDGRRLAYQVWTIMESRVFTVDLLTGTRFRLYANAPRQPVNHNANPDWSPDGTRIAFDSLRYSDGKRFEDERGIFLLDPDGAAVQRLTDGKTVYLEPSWSPDGKYIAAAQARDMNYAIVVLDSSSGEVVRELTDGQHYDSEPDFSPDGRHLIFARVKPESKRYQRDLYLVAEDGRGLRQLTNFKGSVESPDWRPVVEAALR